MKRDMDLVRELLLKIEVADRKPDWTELVDAQDPEAVSAGTEHLKLLKEAGLIAGVSMQPLNGPYQITRMELTWEGHDFLASIRDPEIWDQTKQGVKTAGGFSLDLIKALAKGLIKKKIEDHTGVELDL